MQVQGNTGRVTAPPPGAVPQRPAVDVGVQPGSGETEGLVTEHGPLPTPGVRVASGTELVAVDSELALRTILEAVTAGRAPRSSLQGLVLARTLRTRLLWSRGRAPVGACSAAMRGALVGRLAHRTAHASRSASRMGAASAHGRRVGHGSVRGGGAATSTRRSGQLAEVAARLRGGTRRGRAALVDVGHAAAVRMRSTKLATRAGELLARATGRDLDEVRRADAALQPLPLALDDRDLLLLRLVDGRIVAAEPEGTGADVGAGSSPDAVPPMGGAPLRPEPNGGVDGDDEPGGRGTTRAGGIPEGFLVAVAIATLLPLALVALVLLLH